MTKSTVNVKAITKDERALFADDVATLKATTKTFDATMWSLVRTLGVIGVQRDLRLGATIKDDSRLLASLEVTVRVAGWDPNTIGKLLKGATACKRAGVSLSKFGSQSALQALQPRLWKSATSEATVAAVKAHKGPIGTTEARDMAKALRGKPAVSKVVVSHGPTDTPADTPADEPTTTPLTVAQVIDRIGRAVDGLTAVGVAGHVDDIDDIIAALAALAAECREVLVSA